MKKGREKARRKEEAKEVAQGREVDVVTVGVSERCKGKTLRGWQ